MKEIPSDYSPATLGYLMHKKISKKDLVASILYLIDKKNVGLSFTYELLKSCKPQQFVTGSAQPQLTIKNLSKLNINIPDDKKIMDKFIKDTISFEKIIQKNKEENVNLFNLKEILLNKYFNLLN